MGGANGIEAGFLHHFDTTVICLIGTCRTQNTVVVVNTAAAEQGMLAVDIEALAVPTDGTNTKLGLRHVVAGGNNAGIQLGTILTPQRCVGNRQLHITALALGNHLVTVQDPHNRLTVALGHNANLDQNWTCNGKAVTLPHDAMIHEKRVPGHASGSAQAFFPGGSYVYEKAFEKRNAEHMVFQFEGVYKNAKVFINGEEAGGARYGYIPFFVCADELLRDRENTIRVECENNDQPDSRWYTGAGIYRPVWLWTGPKNSIPPEAVKVQTVSIDSAKTYRFTDINYKVASWEDQESMFLTYSELLNSLDSAATTITICNRRHSHANFEQSVLCLSVEGCTGNSAFHKLGYDPDVLGFERVHNITKRIRRAARAPEGIKGRAKSRMRISKGNFSSAELEKMSRRESERRLQNEIVHLQQQMAFLKKLMRQPGGPAPGE